MQLPLLIHRGSGAQLGYYTLLRRIKELKKRYLALSLLLRVGLQLWL